MCIDRHKTEQLDKCLHKPPSTPAHQLCALREIPRQCHVVPDLTELSTQAERKTGHSHISWRPAHRAAHGRSTERRHLCRLLDTGQCGARQEVQGGGPDSGHGLWHRLEHSRTSQCLLSKKNSPSQELLTPVRRLGKCPPEQMLKHQGCSRQHPGLVGPRLTKMRGQDNCSALRIRT